MAFDFVKPPSVDFKNRIWVSVLYYIESKNYISKNSIENTRGWNVESINDTYLCFYFIMMECKLSSELKILCSLSFQRGLVSTLCIQCKVLFALASTHYTDSGDLIYYVSHLQLRK